MGAPAELFLLVEEFLKEQGCVNSLKAFQKEAKNVSLAPSIAPPPLVFCLQLILMTPRYLVGNLDLEIYYETQENID